MTSATLLSWIADTPTSYSRPVQDEDATGGLCGCELPNGTGFLLWPNGGEIHGAVVSSPDDFVVNDVVPSGDIITLATPGNSILGTSCFVIDGVLYAIAVTRISGTGSVTLYEADSATSPTTLTVKTVIQTADASGATHFGSQMGAPIPLVLDSGRWVLVGPRFSTEGLSTWWAQNVGAWYSDDDGATWSATVNYQHVHFFTRTDNMSMQAAQDPITGDLFFTSSADSTGPAVQTALWQSTDDGSSWTLVDGDGGNRNTAPRLTLFVDNGINVYAAGQDLGSLGQDFAIYVYDGSGDSFSDWDPTGEFWPAPGSSPDEPTFKAVIAGFGIYFFTQDRVMRVLAQPNWHWGGLMFGLSAAWT